MPSYSDFKVDGEQVLSASDGVMVRSVDSAKSFGAQRVDSAESFGLDRALASDFSGARNAAEAFATAGSAVTGAVETLTSVSADGKRAAGITGVVGKDVRMSAAQWMRERPEATWRFLKEKTREAWEPAEDQDGAASEVFGEGMSAAGKARRLPAKVASARRTANARASLRLERWDGKAALHERKAGKTAHLRADAGNAAPAQGLPSVPAAAASVGASLADGASLRKGVPGVANVDSRSSAPMLVRLRLRHHERKAERLRGEGKGLLATVMKARRAKNAAVQKATSRKFLLGAAASFAVVAILSFGLVVAAPAALASVFAAVGGGQQSAVNLNEVDARIATFFRLKGLDDLHIAAIMGNMAWESGGGSGKIVPNAEEGGTDGMGIGISQWSRTYLGGGSWAPGRRGALMDFASSQGKPWQDLGVQLEFFWEHDEWGTGWGSGGMTEAAFLDCTDLNTAVEIFCFGWERPNRAMAHLDVRQRHAQRFFAALQASGGAAGGQEYEDGTDAQKRVVDYATAGSLYGCSGGWCQKWVATVYQYATGSWASQCCANMAGDCWAVSMGTQGIPVGATVYGARSYGPVYCGVCGQDAAHVGIYVGDGMVASNGGGFAPVIESLDSFIASYGWAGWGWNGGRNLAAEQ